jgi:Tol biopolymer transport system component
MDGEWLAFSSVFGSPDSPLEGNSSEWGQQVFLRDQKTGSFSLLSAAPNGLAGNSSSASPSLSADGRWIAFQSFADNLVSNDTNGYMDVFVYDRETGTIELVNWAAGP